MSKLFRAAKRMGSTHMKFQFGLVVHSLQLNVNVDKSRKMSVKWARGPRIARSEPVTQVSGPPARFEWDSKKPLLLLASLYKLKNGWEEKKSKISIKQHRKDEPKPLTLGFVELDLADCVDPDKKEFKRDFTMRLNKCADPDAQITFTIYSRHLHELDKTEDTDTLSVLGSFAESNYESNLAEDDVKGGNSDSDHTDSPSSKQPPSQSNSVRQPSSLALPANQRGRQPSIPSTQQGAIRSGVPQVTVESMMVNLDDDDSDTDSKAKSRQSGSAAPAPAVAAAAAAALSSSQKGKKEELEAQREKEEKELREKQHKEAQAEHEKARAQAEHDKVEAAKREKDRQEREAAERTEREAREREREKREKEERARLEEDRRKEEAEEQARKTKLAAAKKAEGSQIEKLRAEIEELERANAELKQTLGKERARTDKALAERMQAEKQREEAETRVRTLQAELKDARTTATASPSPALADEARSKDRKIAELTQLLAKERERTNAMADENSKISQHLDLLKSKANEVEGQLRQNKNAFAEEEKKLAQSLDKTRDQFRTETEELRQQVTQLDEELDKAREANLSLTIDAKRMKELTDENKSLRARSIAFEAVKRLGSGGLQKRIEYYEKQLREADELLTNSKVSWEEVTKIQQQHIDALQASLNEAKAQAELMKQKKAVYARTYAAGGGGGGGGGPAEDAEERYLDLLVKYKQVRADKVKLSQYVNTFEVQLVMKKVELVNFMDRMNDLEQENAKLKAHVHELELRSKPLI